LTNPNVLFFFFFFVFPPFPRLPARAGRGHQKGSSTTSPPLPFFPPLFFLFSPFPTFSGAGVMEGTASSGPRLFFFLGPPPSFFFFPRPRLGNKTAGLSFRCAFWIFPLFLSVAHENGSGKHSGQALGLSPFFFFSRFPSPFSPSLVFAFSDSTNRDGSVR